MERALRFALPCGEIGEKANILKELRVLTRPAVLAAMLTTVAGAGAMFTLYTYVVPALETLTSASPFFITLGLVLIGLGFTVGNWIGGKPSSWSLDGATSVSLIALSLTMFALPLLMTNTTMAMIGLFVWGATAFAVVPPIQTRVMQLASDAPALASSVNVGAFNLGNALGAALGATVLTFNLGYAAVPIAGGLVAILGLLLVVAGVVQSRHAHALEIRTNI